MRRVLKNHREVAHFWANKVQSEGRASRMFFEDGTIYSYGRHFPIAKHYNNDLILFTNRGYSISTSKHIGYVRQAIPHGKTILYCHNPAWPGDEDNLKYALRDIEYNLDRACRARSRKGEYIASAENAYNTIKEIKRIFKIKSWYIPKYDFTKPENVIEMAKDRLKKAEASRKRREAKKRKIALEYVERWKQDLTISCGHIKHSGALKFAYLRINGDTVQTTQGADVPLDDAKLALRALDKGKSLHGLKIGHYTVINYDGEVLTIGCHKIPQSEIDGLKNQLL